MFSSPKKSFVFRCLVSLVNMSFLLSFLSPVPVMAQTPADLGLPKPGTMINLTSSYVPIIAKGLRIHPNNPVLFDFIVDTGNSGLAADSKELKAESEKLIKYFLASLTIPEDDLWVNLSPYEKDRIIPDQLGQTEMGRDMLAQDYVLKQLTASLIYPEKELGQKFWANVYEKAQALYGKSEVPVNTFNKVWIVAEKAKIYVRDNTAFVVDSHLKVLLETDYLALQKATGSKSIPRTKDEGSTTKDLSSLGSTPRDDAHANEADIVRQIIIPEIEKEVNTGKNFANLRQIFNSMILAAWYKKSLKQAFLNQVYSDKAKINGVNVDDATIKDQIYQEYLKAYKKGVFNYIKDDMVDGKNVARKYFSGGEELMRVFKADGLVQVGMDDPAVQRFRPDGAMIAVTAMTPAASFKQAGRIYAGLWGDFITRVLEEDDSAMPVRLRAYRESLIAAKTLRQVIGVLLELKEELTTGIEKTVEIESILSYLASSNARGLEESFFLVGKNLTHVLQDIQNSFDENSAEARAIARMIKNITEAREEIGILGVLFNQNAELLTKISAKAPADLAMNSTEVSLVRADKAMASYSSNNQSMARVLSQWRENGLDQVLLNALTSVGNPSNRTQGLVAASTRELVRYGQKADIQPGLRERLIGLFSKTPEIGMLVVDGQKVNVDGNGNFVVEAESLDNPQNLVIGKATGTNFKVYKKAAEDKLELVTSVRIQWGSDTRVIISTNQVTIDYKVSQKGILDPISPEGIEMDHNGSYISLGGNTNTWPPAMKAFVQDRLSKVSTKERHSSSNVVDSYFMMSKGGMMTGWVSLSEAKAIGQMMTQAQGAAKIQTEDGIKDVEDIGITVNDLTSNQQVYIYAGAQNQVNSAGAYIGRHYEAAAGITRNKPAETFTFSAALYRETLSEYLTQQLKVQNNGLSPRDARYLERRVRRAVIAINDAFLNDIPLEAIEDHSNEAELISTLQKELKDGEKDIFFEDEDGKQYVHSLKWILENMPNPERPVGYNITGDQQKLLDFVFNQLLKFVMRLEVHAIISEEDGDVIYGSGESPLVIDTWRITAFLDPVDGSSQIKDGGAYGSIITFGFLRPSQSIEDASFDPRAQLLTSFDMAFGPNTTLTLTNQASASGAKEVVQFALTNTSGKMEFRRELNYKDMTNAEVLNLNWQGLVPSADPNTVLLLARGGSLEKAKVPGHAQFVRALEGRYGVVPIYSGALDSEMKHIFLAHELSGQKVVGAMYWYPEKKLRQAFEGIHFAATTKAMGAETIDGRQPLLNLPLRAYDGGTLSGLSMPMYTGSAWMAKLMMSWSYYIDTYIVKKNLTANAETLNQHWPIFFDYYLITTARLVSELAEKTSRSTDEVRMALLNFDSVDMNENYFPKLLEMTSQQVAAKLIFPTESDAAMTVRKPTLEMLKGVRLIAADMRFALMLLMATQQADNIDGRDLTRAFTAPIEGRNMREWVGTRVNERRYPLPDIYDLSSGDSVFVLNNGAWELAVVQEANHMAARVKMSGRNEIRSIVIGPDNVLAFPQELLELGDADKAMTAKVTPESSVIYNDGKAAAIGEASPAGELHKKAGMAYIFGTGNNGTAVDADGNVLTYGDTLMELGWNVVRGADGQWRFTGRETQGGKPVMTVGETAFEQNFSGLSIATRFTKFTGAQDIVLSRVTLPSGIGDIGALFALIQEQIAQEDKQKRELQKEAVDVVLRAVTDAVAAGDAQAVRFVTDLGRDIGQALAALFGAYYQEAWVENFIMVSGVGENFAKVPGKDGADDIFVAAIREGVGLGLKAKKASLTGLDDARIRLIADGVRRSTMSWEREILAARLTQAELARLGDGEFYAGGYSVGGTKIGVALIDRNGRMVPNSYQKVNWSGADAQDSQSFVRRMVQTLQTAAVAAGIDPKKIAKIGTAFAGPVNETTGIVGEKFAPPNLPFLKGANLPQDVRAIWNDTLKDAAMTSDQAMAGRPLTLTALRNVVNSMLKGTSFEGGIYLPPAQQGSVSVIVPEGVYEFVVNIKTFAEYPKVGSDGRLSAADQKTLRESMVWLYSRASFEQNLARGGELYDWLLREGHLAIPDFDAQPNTAYLVTDLTKIQNALRSTYSEADLNKLVAFLRQAPVISMHEYREEIASFEAKFKGWLERFYPGQYQIDVMGNEGGFTLRLYRDRISGKAEEATIAFLSGLQTKIVDNQFSVADVIDFIGLMSAVSGFEVTDDWIRALRQAQKRFGGSNAIRGYEIKGQRAGFIVFMNETKAVDPQLVAVYRHVGNSTQEVALDAGQTKELQAILAQKIAEYKRAENQRAEILKMQEDAVKARDEKKAKAAAAAAVRAQAEQEELERVRKLAEQGDQAMTANERALEQWRLDIQRSERGELIKLLIQQMRSKDLGPAQQKMFETFFVPYLEAQGGHELESIAEMRAVLKVSANRTKMLRAKLISLLKITVKEIEQEEKDLEETRGGIDLNTKNLQFDINGDKIDITFDPAMMEQFKRGDFTGVRPVIMKITPIVNMAPLLGFVPRKEEALLAQV